jgi:hypothetical protein
MARAKSSGNRRLEEAMATLLQNQAALVQTQAGFVQSQQAFLAQLAQLERVTAERFARIEAILLEHSRILAEHGRILTDHSRKLQTLPDTIRQKIGFKAPKQPRPAE